MLPHNRAFFFFNLYDSRITQSALVNRTVPLDNFRAGNIGYVIQQLIFVQPVQPPGHHPHLHLLLHARTGR